MGPLSFVNTMFLVGSAAALVPIIIHLVQRRRIQQVVFGSVRFLRKMSHRVVRRRRLTEFLLILLRALALGMLAVAFARPFFWKPTERVGSEAAPGDAVAMLLLDNSYSMNAGDRLKNARQAALDVLDGIDPAVKVGVASFASGFQMLCPLGSPLADARSAVERIEPSYDATDLTMALEQADRQLVQRPEQHRTIILVSDFPWTAWQKRGEWRMTPGIPLEVKNVAGPQVPNVYIERVAVPRLVVAGGFPEVISAKVVNKTDQPVNNAEVVVRIGQKVVEKMSVNIRPNSSSPVHFRRTFDEPGDTTGSIAVTWTDALPEDNIAHFSVRVTPRVKVLIVNGDPSDQLIRNDAFFIRTALAPQVEGQQSPFEIREVRPEALKPDDFTGVDAVLLTNVDSIPDPSVKALTDLVEGGGGVGFVCGAKTDPDKFNQSLAKLAPCRLWKHALSDQDDPVVMNLVDMKHEIFSPFEGPHRGDLAGAVYAQFFAVTDSQAASVLARFSDGQPALLEKAVGKGRSLLFASAMDLEWNNLCLKSVFVPLVHQFTRRLCATRSGDIRDLVVGDRMACPVAAEAEKVELTDPVGKRQDLQPVRLGEGDQAERVAPFTARRPGIYEVQAGKETSRYAVNLDPHEPDLTNLDLREFVSAVQPNPISNVEKVAGAPAVVARATARERAEQRQRLWMYAIGLVLLALGAEMVLAGREQTA